MNYTPDGMTASHRRKEDDVAGVNEDSGMSDATKLVLPSPTMIGTVANRQSFKSSAEIRPSAKRREAGGASV